MHLTKTDRINPVRVFKKLVDDMIEGNVKAYIISVSADVSAPESVGLIGGERIVTGPPSYTYHLEIVSNKPLTIDLE